MGRKLLPVMLASLAITFGVTLQACQKSSFDNLKRRLASPFGNSGPRLVSSANGDEYHGHVSRYVHVDRDHPCQDPDVGGKPMPNQEIFVANFTSDSVPRLVRNGCADLDPPQALKPRDLRLVPDGSGDLIYRGGLFVPQDSVGDFDVVAAACPDGKTALASPERIDLLASSQNLMSPSWLFVPGIVNSLSGSLGGLPAFQILRDDAAYLDYWRRTAQDVTLTAGRTYAFTFVGEPGSVSQAYFDAYDDSESPILSVEVIFDLVSGASQILTAAAATSVSAVTRPFAGGFISTVYFTTPYSSMHNIGVAPYASGTFGATGNYGDYIVATAAQLEDVADFCR